MTTSPTATLAPAVSGSVVAVIALVLAAGAVSARFAVAEPLTAAPPVCGVGSVLPARLAVFATEPPVVTEFRTATLNTAPPAATVGHGAAVSVAV